MRVFICIKPVPDTAAKIKISGDGSSIDSSVKFVLGPYDCRAVAKAVEVRDAGGDGSELIVVSSGNPKKGQSEVRKRIKDVLALGADRGILIPDEGYENRDPLAVAQATAIGLMVTLELLIIAPVVVLVGVRLTHKVAGPLVRINAALQQLTRGDYNVQITLRRGDSLVELADTINALAGSLRARRS